MNKFLLDIRLPFFILLSMFEFHAAGRLNGAEFSGLEFAQRKINPGRNQEADREVFKIRVMAELLAYRYTLIISPCVQDRGLHIV
jgi:hypothetical protein